MGIEYCTVSMPISKYRSHTHDTWEITCQLEGEAETQIGDYSCCAVAGDVLLIPPNTPHKGASSGLFRDFSLRDTMLDFPALAHLHDESGEVVALLSMIHRLHTEENGHYKAAIDSLVQATGKLIQAKLSMDRGSPAVERVKRAIYENMHDPDFILSSVIAESGFDKDYFRRCFTRETGKTPVQFLTDLRIAKARQLLEDPKHFGVEAIAHSCGFADSLYFSTCFKKHVGCSPLQYRKLH